MQLFLILVLGWEPAFNLGLGRSTCDVSMIQWNSERARLVAAISKRRSDETVKEKKKTKKEYKPGNLPGGERANPLTGKKALPSFHF